MTNEQKREICKAYASGYDIPHIAEVEGVTELAAQAAVNEGKVEGIITEESEGEQK